MSQILNNSISIVSFNQRLFDEIKDITEILIKVIYTICENHLLTFTRNCGENSFKTINIPSDSVMFISGLSWKYNLMLKPEIKNTRKWINDFLSIAHPRLANFTRHFVH